MRTTPRSSSLPSVVLGPGADWRVQADPFHDSATVPSWSLLPGVSPTASQEVAVVHETAFMEVLTVPATVSVVHEVPFHCAASEPSSPPPTTLQKAADTQDTEPMKVSPVGVGAADQDVPSQVSACANPSTIMQKSALGQDTAWGSTSSIPGSV